MSLAPPRCPACGRAGPPGARCPCGRGACAPPDPDPLIGRLIGPYAVLARLGAGGSGRVYRALDPRGRPVALKVLRAEGDPRLRRRFAREARAIGALRGRHTARLLDSGEARSPDGRPLVWLAQALVPGRSLRARLDGDRPPPARLPAIAAGILRALEEAHGAGIVHRDLHPGNVMLTPARGVVVLDFGVARIRGGETSAMSRLTSTGALVGTPHYMAPEQIDHRAPIGPTTDLYAVGVVLYELIAGRRPFEGLDPLTVMRARLERPPPPLPRRAPLRAQWGPVIARALALDPGGRPPSARAMRRALVARASRRRWWALGR